MLKLPLISDQVFNQSELTKHCCNPHFKGAKGPNAQIQSKKKQGFQ